MAFEGYIPVTFTFPLILPGITLPDVLSITLSGERLNSGVSTTDSREIVISLSLAPAGVFLLNLTVHVGSDGMMNFTSSPVTLFASRSNSSSPTTALYHALSLP